MTNLQKRIFTSIIALPLSLFFIFKGGYFLLFFLNCKDLQNNLIYQC